jgi:hypothetical protein
VAIAGWQGTGTCLKVQERRWDWGFPFFLDLVALALVDYGMTGFWRKRRSFVERRPRRNNPSAGYERLMLRRRGYGYWRVMPLHGFRLLLLVETLLLTTDGG